VCGPVGHRGRLRQTTLAMRHVRAMLTGFVFNTPFTRSSKHRAKPNGTPPLGSNVGLGLAPVNHVLYRPSNYNPPAVLMSMLITIARRTSSMFVRSCKRGITGANICCNTCVAGGIDVRSVRHASRAARQPSIELYIH